MTNATYTKCNFIRKTTYIKWNLYKIKLIGNETYTKWNLYQTKLISTETYIKCNLYQMQLISNETYIIWNLYQLKLIRKKTYIIVNYIKQFISNNLYHLSLYQVELTLANTPSTNGMVPALNRAMHLVHLLKKVKSYLQYISAHIWKDAIMAIQQSLNSLMDPNNHNFDV